MSKKTFLLFISALLFCLFTISASADTVNVNKASTNTLQQYLTGVGPVKAKAIVSYRNEHGMFKSISELTKVPGIGDALVQLNKEVLSVGEGTANDSLKKTEVVLTDKPEAAKIVSKTE